MRPIKTLRDLPEKVKELPIDGQMLWALMYNQSYHNDLPEEDCASEAWKITRNYFHMSEKDGVWKKGSSRLPNRDIKEGTADDPYNPIAVKPKPIYTDPE